MDNDAKNELSAVEIRDLRDIAGTMIPESPAFGVPGADDPAILADIARPWQRSHISRLAPSPAWTATDEKP
jgi:hypothetical protein